MNLKNKLNQFSKWLYIDGYLLLFESYKYNIDKKNLPFSPYYIASNRCYFKAKKIASEIIDLGYNATLENKIVYDDILEKSGGKRGLNNLFYFNEIGSLFCVNVIKTDYPCDNKTDVGIECKKCNKCKNACITNALKNYNMEVCLRNCMDDVHSEIAKNKTYQLLGCDVCQKICPNNNVMYTNIEYNEFDREKILKGNIKDLENIIGKNMARKKRLIFQAMCLEMKKKDRKNIDIIKKYISDEHIGHFALEVLNSMEKS